MMVDKRGVWDADDCALIIIDYQPEMFEKLRSGPTEQIELNICTIAKAARAFNIPVIMSTVGVEMGVNQSTIQSLRYELPDLMEIDRSTMNAWEDKNFLKAVKETKRKRLVFCALWTEICLAFPVVDALDAGYEVCFPVDAVGGQSLLEHEVAVQRLVQAGAIPNTTCALIAEWFRDWKSDKATEGREILTSYWAEKNELGLDRVENSLNYESVSIY